LSYCNDHISPCDHDHDDDVLYLSVVEVLRNHVTFISLFLSTMLACDKSSDACPLASQLLPSHVVATDIAAYLLPRPIDSRHPRIDSCIKAHALVSSAKPHQEEQYTSSCSLEDKEEARFAAVDQESKALTLHSIVIATAATNDQAYLNHRLLVRSEIVGGGGQG